MARVFQSFDYVNTEEDEPTYGSEIPSAYRANSTGVRRTVKEKLNYVKQW